MPRAVSFAVKDAVETSLNFGEGYGEIVEVEAVVHQYDPNKKTGEQSAPAPMIRMMLQRLKQDQTSDGSEPIEEFFGCGALAKFHPAIASGHDDEEVEDQGDAVGASGNCLIAIDGAAINKRSKWFMFNQSLEAAGFKPDILWQGFLPDLVGLKAHFVSVALPKDADRVYTRDPKALVVKAVLKFPYDKSTAKKGGKASAAAAAPATASSKKASAPPAESNGDAGEDVGDIAVKVLQKLASKNAGATVEVGPKIASKLFTLLGQGVGDGPIPSEMHKPINELFKNQEWIAAMCGSLEYEFADGKITFPKAA